MTKKRGSYSKGVLKRQEILSQALKLIAENGFESTKLRELAESVNLSEAGLLHYFGTKDDLYVEILRENDKNELYELFRLNIEHGGSGPFASEKTCRKAESGDSKSGDGAADESDRPAGSGSQEFESEKHAEREPSREGKAGEFSLKLSGNAINMIDERADLLPAQPREHVGILSRLVQIMAHKAQVPGLVELYSYMSVRAADKNNPAHAYFMERRSISSEISVPMLRRLQKRGIVSAKLAPSDLDRIFNAVTDGLLVQRLIDPDLDIERLLLELCTIIDWTRDPNGNPDIETIKKQNLMP
ncbi:MAG: helix-turn-helix domain-containing protein [Bifidobacterium sp.]|uniref:TetR/AcrR family transcriptional regulator n=1 Tax=Bifidobacterium sp. TaxID=41200 RepID=UPI0039E7F8A0